MRKLTKAIIAVLCIVLCMSIFFACDPAEEPATHEHNYSELKSSATKHWYECPDDGEIKPDSEQAHYDEDRNGKCDLCGHNVTVVDIKGITFAIAGKDGKTDVDLNGVEVTIAYKTNSFKATIADGKFESTEIIPIGEYTVSAEGYNSTTINITKDGIDDAVVVLHKTHTVENSVKIEEVEGVPTLIVDGMIPEIEGVTIGNVMLHYDAEYTLEGASEKTKQHEYIANTSEYAGVYHFELKLTDLPNNPDTPWCWFHIRAYAEENPTSESTSIASVDLNRGDAIKYGNQYTYTAESDIQYIYTIQAENSGEGLCLAIQATKHIGDITITDIKFDSSNGAKLIVKGTYDGGAGYAAIHTDGNSRHYYGQKISVANGEIELTIDLSQITYDDTPWCWFHIYLYEQDPTDPARFDQKIDIQRGSFFNAGEYTDIDGVRYAIVDQGQLTIQPKVAPTINNITSVEIKNVDNKPVLIVKGTTSKDVPCLKIHVDGNGDYYGDGVSATEGQEFELKFDLSQLDTAGKTYYFHLYTYADAEPADNSAKLEKLDVPRNQFATVQANVTFDYNDLRYTLQDNNWNGIPIKVTNVPNVTVSSIAFETIDNVPTLVVKGTSVGDPACIKLHTDKDGTHYYGNDVSTTAGEFELRLDLTQLTQKDAWYWCHIYVYDNEADPEDATKYSSKQDLLRDTHIELTDYIDYGTVRYGMPSDGNTWGMVVIKPIDVPAYEVTSIAVDETSGKPVLVVKIQFNQLAVAGVAIHTDGNGVHWYGDVVAITATGEYTLTFDLTQLTTAGTPWCWFHIYAYTSAGPDDLSAYGVKVDLPRGTIAVGDSWTCDGVKYTVQNKDQLVIQPNNA